MDNPNLIPSSDPLYEPISLAYQRTQQPTQADLVQSAARDAIKDLSNWQSGRLPSRPDTYQSYFEDPNKLARYHTLIQSSPEGWQAPEWMDVAGIESAYKWMEFRNNGEPWTNWKPLAEDDPGLKFIRTLSQPPNEILMPNELQYAKVEPTPQELLEAQYKQLGFKTVDWGELPFFAKFYTTMFSPQPMQGRPDWSRGTASAVQGALGGLGGAAVGAAVGGAPGAVLGFLAVGIPSGIQAYTGEEVVPGMSQALNFFNIPAQWAERSMGLINLAASRSLEAVKDNLPAAWEAAGLKYETQQTDLLNLMAAAQQKVEPLITGRPSQIKLAGPNEVWQISKGYAEPVPLFDRNLTSVGPRSGAAMWQAVERINNGESPEIVYADFMSRYGDTGTFNDFISQTVLDPLNLVPFAEGVVGEKAASLAGEPRLAEAFKIGRGNLGIDALPFGLQQIVSAVTGAKGSEGLLGTLRNYKDWVRGGYWSEKALKYLPVDEATGKPIIPEPENLSRLDKYIGGLTPEGLIKEIQPAEYKGLTTFWNQIRPDHKAMMYLDNLVSATGTLITQVDDAKLGNVERADQLAKVLQQMTNNNPVSIGDVGEQIFKSPQMATVVVALRDYIQKGSLNERMGEWVMLQPSIQELHTMADVLGMDVANLVDRIKADPKGTLATIIEKTRQSITEAQASGKQPPDQAMNIIRQYENRFLTPETFADRFAPFTGEKKSQGGETLPAAPFDFRDWRARVMNDVIDSAADWLKSNYNLQQDSTFYRFAGLLKSMQSIALLDANPLYAINNALNNWVTRASEGIFGFMTKRQIDDWFEQFGIVPLRLREGPGSADLELGQGAYAANMIKLRNVSIGDDALGKAIKAINKTRHKFGIASMLSGKMEASESAQAYAIAMKDMWDKLWKPGVGYRKMPAKLEIALQNVNPDLPEYLYAGIRAGLNMDQIEGNLYASAVDVQLSRAIDTAARKIMPSNPEIATNLLRSTGLDTVLRGLLAKAQTPKDVDQAMDYLLNERLPDILDEKTAFDVGNAADEVKARLRGEGFAAVVDLWTDAQIKILDRWFLHFNEISEVVNKSTTADQQTRNAYWRAQNVRDAREFGRVNSFELQVYNAISDSLGLDRVKVDSFVNRVIERQLGWSDAYHGYDVDAITGVRLDTEVDPITGQKRVIPVWEVNRKNARHVKGRDDLLREFFTREYATKSERSGAWERTQDAIRLLMKNATQKELELQGKIDNAFANMFAEQGGDIQAALAWRKTVNDLRLKMIQIRDEFWDKVLFENPQGDERRLMFETFINEKYKPLIFQLKSAEIYGARSMTDLPLLTYRNQPAATGETVSPGTEPIVTTAPAPETGVPEEMHPVTSHVNQSVIQAAAQSAKTKAQTIYDAKLNRKIILDQIRAAFDATPEEINAIRAVMDLHAENWAKQNPGKTVEDWYAEHIAGIEKGDGQDVALLQADQGILDIARRYNIPTATEIGKPNNRYLLNIIKKYGGEEAQTITKMDEVTSELADKAFKARAIDKGEAIPKGAVDYLQDGRAIIRAFEAADVSTLVHEIGHVFLADITGTDRQAVAMWGGLSSGDELTQLHTEYIQGKISEVNRQRYIEMQEKFARGWERYLAEDNTAIPPKMRSVFQQFTEWLKNIYKKISGSAIDVDIKTRLNIQDVDGTTKEISIKDVLDRALFDDEQIALRKEKAEVLKIMPTGSQTYAWGIKDATKAYDMRYKLVDLADLIMSNNLDFSENMSYPKELQARLRGRVSSRQQVNDIAIKLNADKLLFDSHAIDEGAPIVGSDLVVESGNARSMAIREASLAYPEAYKAYVEALKKYLPSIGLTEQDMSGIQKPVLVRERVSGDRVAFADDANAPRTLQMSPFELAIVDADKISMAQLQDMFIYKDLNILEALDSPMNKGIVQGFVGSLSKNEQGSVLSEGGQLTPDGKMRLVRALFARVYPGEEGQRLLQKLVEGETDTIKYIQTAILQSLPSVGVAEGLMRDGVKDPALSLARDVSTVVDFLAMQRNQGKTIADYFTERATPQLGILEDLLTPLQEKLLTFIDNNKRSPRPLRLLLEGYAREVINSVDQGQTSFLDIERPAKDALFDKAASNAMQTYMAERGQGTPMMPGFETPGAKGSLLQVGQPELPPLPPKGLSDEVARAQAAELLKEAAKPEQRERFLTDLKAVAKETGAIFDFTKENKAVKGIDRTTEKIMDGRFVSDALRNTLVVDTPEAAYDVIRAMEQRGYKIWDNPYGVDNAGNRLPASPDLEDLYQDPTPGYKHVAVKFVFGPDDPVVKELQMLTPAMAKAKAEIGHDIYDVTRAIEDVRKKGYTSELADSLYTELKAQSNEIYSEALGVDMELRSLASRSSNSTSPINASAANLLLDKFDPRLSEIALSSLNDFLNTLLAPKSAKYSTASNLPDTVFDAFVSLMAKHSPTDIIAESEGKSNIFDTEIIPPPIEAPRPSMVEEPIAPSIQPGLPEKYSMVDVLPSQYSEQMITGNVVDESGNVVALIPVGFKPGELIDTIQGKARLVGLDPADVSASIYELNGELHSTNEGRSPAQPGLLQVQAVGDMAGRMPVNLNDGELLQDMNGNVKRLIEQVREEAKSNIGMRPMADYNLPEDVLAQVKAYLGDIRNDMSSSKLATLRYGETKRDMALLNYNKQTGFDTFLNAVLPYQFWYTRSMANWASRMIDKPQWFSFWARMRDTQRKYEQQGVPSRLWGKIKMPAPYLPSWTGGSLYTDPWKVIFPFETAGNAWESLRKDKTQQIKDTESMLRQQQNDGQITLDQLNAALESHQGPDWDRAFAQISENGVNEDPMTMASMMVTPSLFLQNPGKSGLLPYARIAAALKTSLSGTPLDAVGNIIGKVAEPERWLRNKFGISEFGEWGDYYVDRMISNMAADGSVDAQAALIAMTQHSGPVYDQAVQQVEYETALRSPGVSMIEMLKSGKVTPGTVMASMFTSVFPGGLVPQGELEQRGLKTEYNNAWAKLNAGDKNAINDFFKEHPEYQARLALWDKPEERMRQFLISEIWDKYTELKGPAKRMAVEQLGPAFETTFIDKNTRDYTVIDIPTLAWWSKILGGNVPKTPDTAPLLTEQPLYLRQNEPKLQLYPQGVNDEIQMYWDEKNRLWPNVTSIQDEYYKTGTNKAAILRQFPELRAYWDWKKQYEKDHPVVAIYNAQTKREYDQADLLKFNPSKEIKQPIVTPYTSINEVQNYDSALLSQLSAYFVADQPLTDGAKEMLQQIWVKKGRPGGSFERFVNDILQPVFVIQ